MKAEYEEIKKEVALHLSERLMELVDRYGSIKKLWKVLDVDYASLRHWVYGERFPNIVTLKMIADKCGVTVAWLLGED